MEINVCPRQVSPLNPIWSFGGNTCHVPLWLRRDVQRHISMVHKELGFQYIRAHGILSDNMNVVDSHGKFNFDKVNQSLRAVLSSGCRPFVELSAMPGKFASSDSSVCHYIFRSAPPRDWGMWSDLIGAFIDNLLDEFGENEICQWYFEVWNEPDIAFWSGTQREYFRLYDIARREIKIRCPSLRVGGPATSKTAWIDDFLDHVGSPSADDNSAGFRCDFISTHAYPSDVEFLDAAQGEVELKSASIMRELYAEVRRKVDAAAGEGFPVIAGEWNSSAGPLAENHDACNNAAFITKTMIELSELAQGSLYWNISDIYEECDFHYQPFHGGYGLLTVNDIPKSSFNAFALLNSLDGERVLCGVSENSESCGAIAVIKNGNIRILLYHYIEPGEEQSKNIGLRINGLPEDKYSLKNVCAVTPSCGSAYETWLELGAPEYANLNIMKKLSSASCIHNEPIKDNRREFNIPPGSVYMLDFRGND